MLIVIRVLIDWVLEDCIWALIVSSIVQEISIYLAKTINGEAVDDNQGDVAPEL